MSKIEYAENETERKAFALLLPELLPVLERHNLPESAVRLKAVEDSSSVCFIDDNNKICTIRLRKQKWYLSISKNVAEQIPDGAEIWKALVPGEIRVRLNGPEDITKYAVAIQTVLSNKIAQFHTFDCCGRYEVCSNEKKCIHPDPIQAIGCSYRKNLVAGRIFYGKNKNV